MMTLDEAVFLFKEALRLNLSGVELLEDPVAVQRDCNGIGAEWMGEVLRSFVTGLNPSLRPVAAIHDRRYACCQSSEEQRFADEEFRINGRKAAKQFPWWRPRRYVILRNVEKYYIALRCCGFLAWEEV